MSKFIADAWLPEMMPIAMLLAVFLNPAIGSDPLFKTRNYCNGKTLFVKSEEIAAEENTTRNKNTIGNKKNCRHLEVLCRRHL